jgi:hypothetical protein
MEYQMVEERSESGTRTGAKRFFLSPSNASYNNTFKSTSGGESTLTLKFVPVPPPERFTDRISMPDLLGLTREEAETALLEERIQTLPPDIAIGKTSNGKPTEVTGQTIPPGKILQINEKVGLKILVSE